MIVITVARKPIEGTIAGNVLVHGAGGLNIDGCRVACDPEDFAEMAARVEKQRAKGGFCTNSWKNSSDISGANPSNPLGRWPGNFLLAGAPSTYAPYLPACHAKYFWALEESDDQD